MVGAKTNDEIFTTMEWRLKAGGEEGEEEGSDGGGTFDEEKGDIKDVEIGLEWEGEVLQWGEEAKPLVCKITFSCKNYYLV